MSLSRAPYRMFVSHVSARLAKRAVNATRDGRPRNRDP